MPLAQTRFERQSTSDSLRQHYKKPPIQEVIFEVKAELPNKPTKSAVLLQFGRRLEPRFVASDLIDERPNDTETNASRISGQEFRSTDSLEIVRARSDGFSFHRLPPYTRWEEWLPRASGALEHYRAVVKPTRLTWASVRYVNRIRISTPADLGDFFLSYPEIGQGIPQSVAGFYMQVTIPHSSGTFIVLRQGMIEPNEGDAVAIILDIQTLSRLSGKETGPEITAIASRLHDIEIETFERCITNRTRELFQ